MPPLRWACWHRSFGIATFWEKNLVSVVVQPSANALAIRHGRHLSLTIQNAIIQGKGRPVTTDRRTFVAVCLFGSSKNAAVAISPQLRAPGRSAIILSVVSLLLFVWGSTRSS